MLDLAHLNDNQRLGVTSDARNLIILAGPGSGKTRVLTHRIAWFVEQGVNPGHILAVTFTNKAAGEMKERLAAMLPPKVSEKVTARTFHSFGARLLRREARTMAAILAKPGTIVSHIDRKELPVGDGVRFNTNFTIYDDGDQRGLLTAILKEMNLDSKKWPVGEVATAISTWKNKGLLPGNAQLLGDAGDDNAVKVQRDIYAVYQSKLLAANAADFDDLILYPMLLFENDTATLQQYQCWYPYVLIDEYQDTNGVQYRLSELLTAHSDGRLTIVGDDDQAIYGFRGADFTNVQRLRQTRPDHELVLLERNYRSTPQIVQAASALIGNNAQRVAKKLWTKLTGGDGIEVLSAADGDKEAQLIAEMVVDAITAGSRQPADFAILYRTNGQSRLLETALLQAKIPYRLARGVSFYQRKEIKDAIAYLRLLYNGDPLAFQRIANVPRRGLGDKTVEAVVKTTSDLRQWLLNYYAAGERVGGVTASPATWKKLAHQYGLSVSSSAALKVWEFAALLNYLNNLPDPTPRELVEATIGILRPGIEEQERIENLLELLSLAEQVEGTGIAGLEAFLESAALATDTEASTGDDDDNRVTLATLHAAKGLEWPVVFLAGAEDDYCPHSQAKGDGRDGIEEERRLFYVGVTRAQQQLYITYAHGRFVWGDWKWRDPSPFIGEMGL